MQKSYYFTGDGLILFLLTEIRIAKRNYILYNKWRHIFKGRRIIIMHKFLRAIGFSKIKKEELEKLFDEIIEHPTVQKIAEDSEENEFAEFSKEFGEFFGISVRGIFKDDDTFEMDYYYPYFCGKSISTMENPEIEKHAEKESYAGVCDEVRVGVTLIFYLQNIVDYLAVKENRFYQGKANGVILGALSTEGKILLPINKSEEKQKQSKQNTSERNHLIAAARNGDEDAIENLTLEDIDTYSLLSRRIMHEDILSIVDNYFMPYGIESDQYSILGEIMDWSLLQNEVTGENIYALDILCSEIPFSLCINQKDLIGEPAVGRRFKGNIWLQGSINYHE